MKKSNISDLDSSHPLRYHIELVRLMAMCTKGKNAVNEYKKIRIVLNKDPLFGVKNFK